MQHDGKVRVQREENWNTSFLSETELSCPDIDQSWLLFANSWISCFRASCSCSLFSTFIPARFPSRAFNLKHHLEVFDFIVKDVTVSVYVISLNFQQVIRGAKNFFHLEVCCRASRLCLPELRLLLRRLLAHYSSSCSFESFVFSSVFSCCRVLFSLISAFFLPSLPYKHSNFHNPLWKYEFLGLLFFFLRESNLFLQFFFCSCISSLLQLEFLYVFVCILIRSYTSSSKYLTFKLLLIWSNKFTEMRMGLIIFVFSRHPCGPRASRPLCLPILL